MEITTQKTCIACPESFADEEVTIFESFATHKYNQLQPMCDKHFFEVINAVEKICHTKFTQKDLEKYKL